MKKKYAQNTFSYYSRVPVYVKNEALILKIFAIYIAHDTIHSHKELLVIFIIISVQIVKNMKNHIKFCDNLSLDILILWQTAKKLRGITSAY